MAIPHSQAYNEIKLKAEKGTVFGLAYTNDAFQSQGNAYTLVSVDGTTYIVPYGATLPLPYINILYIQLGDGKYGVTVNPPAGQGPQADRIYHISYFQGDFITLNSHGVPDIRYNRLN